MYTYILNKTLVSINNKISMNLFCTVHINIYICVVPQPSPNTVNLLEIGLVIPVVCLDKYS